MSPRPLQYLALAALVTTAAPGLAQAPKKRPFSHADYAAWRSLQAPALSPDGNLVAFAVAPQEGDGEFVLLDLRTGKGLRHPRGARPTLAVTGPRAPGLIGASRHLFSPDGKFVLFPIYPAKAAKVDRTKMLTGSALGIMEAATGKTVRVENVRGYQVNETGPAFVAYLRSVQVVPDPTKGPKKPPTPPTAPAAKAPPPTVIGELVLRELGTGRERTFSNVTEFMLSEDGKALVYAANPQEKGKQGGVFMVTPGAGALPVCLRAGPGKFSRLTWDDKQTQLAFFHSPVVDPKAPPAPPAIIHWKRASSPVPVVLPTPTGLAPPVTALQAGAELKPNGKALIKAGWQAHERGGLAFSLDGGRLFFGLVPPPPPKPAPGRPVVELWHYKDDFIQPMQKARYGVTQGKTYRAFFDLGTGACRQLADEATPEVSVAPAGDLAIGADDRPYRRLIGSTELRALADLSLINLKTGERKALLKKEAGVAWSPGGKYLMRWDGKAWYCINLATGKSANLTEKLEKVPFANELFDQPSGRPSFGIAGWLPDDESVLVYDRYDIWRFAPDGSSRKNITAGLGAKHETSLRVVQLDPKERFIDPKKPLLLRAENEKTRDTGFYRVEMGKEPQLLIMGARYYSNPIKAKKGDRYLLTVSTFSDYPDLYVADLNFKEVRRITNLDAQKKPFVWGKAEMVKYRSADGVPLQGVLLKPDNFDSDRKYPMIVYIYERLSQNRHRFIEPRPGTSINPTYYVSNGYLVLMPDIAYTVGYPGQSAEKCILPAIDKVIDQGCVDEKAIGIQGHSWGGYQTAYLVTRTTRFKAAAAGAPVTNMTSAYGGIRWGTGLPRQWQYERAQSRIGGSLWEYPTRFLENSPLFSADRVKTPLLMLHNDHDEAVPWQEGIQYYLALRRLEKEAYLFNYVGEGHGLRQRKNQADYTVRMQQFFDHHLKGAPKPAWMEKGEPYSPPPTAPPATTRAGRRGTRGGAG